MTKPALLNLVKWLVLALGAQFLIERGWSLFALQQQSGATTDAERIRLLAEASAYQEVAAITVGLLVNFVIAIWLYRQSSANRLLWAVLGLFAKWWALVLFALYVFTDDQSQNT